MSDDPGHLMMAALCDSNCRVDLGRLTLLELPVDGASAGEVALHKVGHYVRYPPAAPVSGEECAVIETPR